MPEYHDWLVNEEGEFLEDMGCGESGKPDQGNVWRCASCGSDAEFKDDEDDS